VDKFRILLSPKAAKDLDGFSDNVCAKIASSLRSIEENPFPRGKLIKKLKGTKEVYYRLRADKHRVFYMIEGSDVIVLRVLSKKDAEKFIRQLG
jgi:mRNA interferase RelE/StbE